MSRKSALSYLLLTFLGPSNVSGFATFASSRKRARNTPFSVNSMLVEGSAMESPSLLPFLETNSITSALNAFYETQPYLSAFLTCGCKASAADLIIQSQTSPADKETQKDVSAEVDDNDENTLDVRRNLAFLLYGGLYQGMVQQYLITSFYPSVFGTDVTVTSVCATVALEMLAIAPFLNLPIAYLVKGVVAHGEGVVEGMQRYVEHVQHEQLLVRFWSIWIPVQCLTFSVIPQHLRIVFVAMVSFFWLMLLSSISSRQHLLEDVEEEELQQAMALD